jgi:glutamate-1-semialdehyde aminotransferase
MHWMVRWAGGFPLFVESAEGSHFVDVDGRRYLDLCLGDTGAMTGHAPPAAVTALAEQARRGATFMLPTEDAVGVGEELARRFGLPYWQIALTATDANRFAIRLARHRTGRPKILVFHGCYHGTVDETFACAARGPDRRARGQPRASRRSGFDHARRGVQRPSRARGGAVARRRCVRARRARDDERRHRPAGAGLPRSDARADAALRDAPDPGRDAHDLRRA